CNIRIGHVANVNLLCENATSHESMLRSPAFSHSQDPFLPFGRAPQIGLRPLELPTAIAAGRNQPGASSQAWFETSGGDATVRSFLPGRALGSKFMGPWRRGRHGWECGSGLWSVARYYFTRPLNPAATMSIVQAAWFPTTKSVFLSTPPNARFCPFRERGITPRF